MTPRVWEKIIVIKPVQGAENVITRNYIRKQNIVFQVFEDL